MSTPTCVVKPTSISLVWKFISPLAFLLAAADVMAATVTWDASGANPAAPTDGAGNWSTANANWSSGSADGVWTNGNNAILGSGGAGGAVAIGGGVVVANLTINTNYTFNSNPLALSNSIITVAGSANSSTIGNVLTGTAFTKEGAGTLILNPGANNTYTGSTIINNGTVQAGGNDARVYIPGDLQVNPNGTFILTSGGAGVGVIASNATLLVNGGTVLANVSGKYQHLSKLVLDNNGTVKMHPSAAGNFYFNPTNIDARSGNIFANLYRAISINTFKSTTGTVVITNRPNTSTSDGYIVTMNAGTLIFDKSSQNANRLLPNAPLTLGGGSLVFSNGTVGINPSTEAPGAGGTTLNPGASSVLSTNVGATGGSVALGIVTRKVGGTLDFFKIAAGGSTITNANVNGILGGWGTWNKSDWLAGSGAATPFTLAPLAAGSYSGNADATTWLTTTNVSLSGNPTANLDDVTINSLRLTAASTVTINSTKTLTLSSGGLLVTGSGAATITGGNLKSGVAGGDLIIHQYGSADLTIASDLADNSGSSLTKSGLGKLILTGVNSMTGTNYLNGGTTEVSTLAKLASGPLVLNAATLRYTGGTVSDSRAVSFNGLGGTFDVPPSTTLTLAGAVRGSGAAIGDLGGLVKTGAGTLTLTASNYFNGPTVVSNGVLVINGTNAYDKLTWDAGKVTVYATLSGNGTVAGPVTVKSGGTISPGSSIGTLALATNLTLESGSFSLLEVTNGVAGDLLAVQGNLVIQTNCSIAINVLGTPLEPTTNTLITYTGTKSGSFNPTIVISGGSLNASISLDESTPGQIKLVAVPQVAITSQPQDSVVSTNDPATFMVSATGSAPVGYQWYFSGNNTNNAPILIPSANSAAYNIASAQGTDSGFYSVVVTNNFNSVTSRFALLIVGYVPPSLTGPVNTTVIAGNNVTFNTTLGIANPPPALQWQTNGVNVAGATNASLTLNTVPFSLNNTIVSVSATNLAGSVTNSAILTVIVSPVITPQPLSMTTNVGNTVVFTSGATGVPTPGLQWFKNGVPISGETGSTLTLVNVQGSDIGTYTLTATNAAGTATSTGAKLTVVSTSLALATLAPANAATGVCYDTPLAITFNSPVSVRNAGKIRIYNSTNSVTPVDTIDMASNNVVVSTLNSGQGIFLTNNIQAHGAFQGDSTTFNYFPVITTGSTAVIYPHLGVLTSNQTYYVTLDTGIVADGSGAYFTGIADTNAWRFTTKPGGPVNPTNLVVAVDGSGDFVTVQGAVDFVPSANTTPRLINIRNGNYVEIVNISGKNKLTLRGQSRTGTVVGYGNNNNLNPSTGNRMAFKVNANDIAVENLTLVNTTPQGGTQAETIMLNTGAARFIVNNAEVRSLQDTILANVNSSQAYINNSTIKGNFDYIWGGGNLFVTNSLIYTVSNIYVTNNYNFSAARTDFSATSNSTTHWLNPAGSFSANGFSFVKCQLQADPAVTTVTLAAANGTPNGVVSFIGCLIDTNHYVTPAPAILSGYVLWEYGNSNIDGTLPVSLGLTVLPNNDPRLLAAQSATNWLYGWSPQLAPNILTNPVGLTVNYAAPATFTVAATGIPDPTYQWQHAGTNVTDATNATLTIAGAVTTDAGSYTVIVTTSAGSVTSSSATLVVNPPPNAAPVFTAPPADTNIAINVGVSLAVSCTATDSDVPAQTLTYSLLAGPSGAAMDSGSGNFIWRPTVAQSNSVNNVSVKVTDNGTPNLSATNSFTVTVNPLTAPVVTAPAITGGQFSLIITGQTGPDYTVQVSTNLAEAGWATILTTNSPAMPFTFTDTNSLLPLQFYRILVGP